MPTKDPVKRRAQQARWRENNRARHVDGVRWAKIKANYGLTREQWHEILANQGGRCAICLTEEPKGRGQWHVDHDHATGKVRGLLCARCNRGLGLFSDSLALLRATVSYLETHTSP